MVICRKLFNVIIYYAKRIGILRDLYINYIYTHIYIFGLLYCRVWSCESVNITYYL